MWTRISSIVLNRGLCTNSITTNQPIKQVQTIRKLLLESEANNEQLFKVYGWIRGRIQRQKHKWFVHLDDGSSSNRLQVVIPSSLINHDDDDSPLSSSKIQNGVSLECIGRLTPSLGHQQSLEFQCESFRIIGHCPPSNYQIGHLKTGLEFDFLREQIHLRPRVRYFQSLLRIRHELIRAIDRFMVDNDFCHVQVPLITANDCEGGGECFTLKPANWPSDSPKQYFGRPTYLTVSGQLHLEALASSISRVYTLSQVFRAEKSMSPKHLSEFLMLELEQCFLFDLPPLLDLVERMFHYLVNQLEQNVPNDLEFLLDKNQHHKTFEKLKNPNGFIRITYLDAVKILSEKYAQFKTTNKSALAVNLNAEMERHLLSVFDQRPVFVTEYPMQLKPFYMKSKTVQLPEEEGNGEMEVAECFDLLSPICGEVCGGSLREYRLQRLQEQIKQIEMNEQQQQNHQGLEWYLDLRRFGSAPSGGFGLGFDRFIQSVCGVSNIKDVIPFPRWPYHCYL